MVLDAFYSRGRIDEEPGRRLMVGGRCGYTGFHYKVEKEGGESTGIN
jgi:hypothetical protein